MDAARTDLTRQEVDELGERIAEHASHLDAATHRLLADIREFDRTDGWARQGARSCADWVAWRLNWDGNTAREHVRVARALGQLPRIDAVFARGELSYSKVRAMTRVATPENEELLLVDAQYSTGTQLETICRKYAMVRRGVAPTPEDDQDRRRVTRRDLDDGMVRIQATLHPEEAEIVWAALTRIAGERNAQHGTFSRADALMELVQQMTRGRSPDRTPTDVVVTVAVESLAETTTAPLVAATTADGACLSTQTARRLACDAGIVTMIEDAKGNCVSVGRKTRSIPPSMKRALLRRDKMCRFPGCRNHLFVDGHHVEHWANGGETRLSNLVLLCSAHHRYVHEYGYSIVLDVQQQPHFFDPRGTPVPELPPRPRMVDDGRERIERANADLDITAETAFPRWDGHRPNYGWIIDDLCRADRLH